MTKHATWSEEYKIASYFVNLRGRAGLYAILNFIQDVGWMHAGKMQVKLEPHQGWVFTRQNLKMIEWPKWNEVITVKTWLRPPKTNTFLYRDYEIYHNEQKIGECTSTFSVIDMQTRKIVGLDLTKFNVVYREDYQLELQPQKIVWQSQVKELAQFQVRNSDLDMNNHVNNTKYAQWILDALPLDILKGNTHLEGYEINFLSETKSGDVVSVQMVPPDEGSGLTQFQGVRVSDGKPVFTARMYAVDQTMVGK